MTRHPGGVPAPRREQQRSDEAAAVVHEDRHGFCGCPAAASRAGDRPARGRRSARSRSPRGRSPRRAVRRGSAPGVTARAAGAIACASTSSSRRAEQGGRRCSWRDREPRHQPAAASGGEREVRHLVVAAIGAASAAGGPDLVDDDDLVASGGAVGADQRRAAARAGRRELRGDRGGRLTVARRELRERGAGRELGEPGALRDVGVRRPRRLRQRVVDGDADKRGRAARR